MISLLLLGEPNREHHVADLYVKRAGKIMINLRVLTGNSFQLLVDPEETVGAVKAKMYQAHGFPVETQSLVFGSKKQEDDKTLQDCKIIHQSTCFLLFKPAAQVQ